MEIRTIAPFLEYFARVRERTARVIDVIPEDRLDWTYKTGKFTFADLIRHLAAIERFMYAETVQGKPSRYSGHGRELADGVSEVRAFFDTMHAESMGIFSRLTDEDLRKHCITPNGTSITTWKWLRAMVEHEIHHRGQIYLYLSMLDQPSPPLFGLTSEQVLEKSRT